MKKKIVSLLFMFCLFIPCLALSGCDLFHSEHDYDGNYTIDSTHHWYKCKECNEVKDKELHNWDDGVVVTEATGHEEGSKLVTCLDCNYSKVVTIPVNISLVTPEEWESALSFENTEDIKIENSGYSLAIDGVTLYINTYEDNVQKYATINDGKYILYTKTSETWTKEEIDEDSYNLLYGGFDAIVEEFSTLSFEDFTYNHTTRLYEVTNLEVGELLTPNKIELSFENQKVMSISVTVNGETELMHFSYEDQIVTLPEKMVTFEEWETAFQCDFDNYQFNMIQSSEDVSGIMGIKRNYDTICVQATEGVEVIKQYQTIESGKFYAYRCVSDDWLKREITEEDFYEISIGQAFSVFTDNNIFSEFVFNFVTGAYETENLQLDADNLLKSMHVFFENNRISRIVCVVIAEGLEVSGECTFTYNNEILELPETYTTLATPFVTTEEMAVALDFLNIDNYQMIISLNEEIVQGTEGKKYGNVLLRIVEETYSYANIEDGIYYLYEKNDDLWTKTEITASEYRNVNMPYYLFASLNLDMDELISSLTYNKYEESYEVYNITDGSSTIDTLSLYFEDLKLVKAIFNVSGEGLFALHLTYNDEIITLPSLGEITEAQWRTAIVFDGVDQYQLSAVQNDSEVSSCVIDGEIVLNTYGDGDSNETYVSCEGDEYYKYSNSTGTWTKENINQELYESMKKPLELDFLIDRFAEFVFNPTTGVYEAENVEGFDMGVNPDVSLAFQEGRLIMVVVTVESEASYVYVTYNDITLTLPSVEA